MTSDNIKLDTSKPHSARMYDYYLGGKDNYEVDRDAAEQVITRFPEIKQGARTNRAFMHRAARWLTDQGIRQFLDIGTGIPSEPNLHQIVQRTAPEARIVYVDSDPIVLRHGEALLRSTPQGSTDFILADVRDPEKIIEQARTTLDFNKPIALSLVALLHFVSDEYNPTGIVTKLVSNLPSGSFLVLSHVTGDFDQDTWDSIVSIYRNGGTPAQVRSRPEVAQFFEGLVLTDPGIVPATDWHPDNTQPAAPSGQAPVPLYAGVGRKA
ncbi:SAM-dependent methyltransferase [Streptomyces sp. NPDC059092]|uniref:SAM-dependent methyltransferase n=1 Tax=Streptomyces sp. NPDC059092 TaxID=3346725 RepID=UPI0036CCDDC2